MHPAVVRGVDSKTDLAVLFVPNITLPAVQWANSDQVQVGDYVLALGYPFESAIRQQQASLVPPIVQPRSIPVKVALNHLFKQMRQ